MYAITTRAAQAGSELKSARFVMLKNSVVEIKPSFAMSAHDKHKMYVYVIKAKMLHLNLNIETK
jgi:hypothetical protein